MHPLQVLIIGDHDTEHPAHRAARDSVIAAAASLRLRANTRWVGADDLVLYPGLVAEAAGLLLPPPGPRCPRLLPEPEIQALQQARELGVPCLAMGEAHALLLIEFARNVLSLAGANSTLYDDDPPFAVVNDRTPHSKLAGEAPLAPMTVTLHASSENTDWLSIGDEWSDASHGLGADYAAAFDSAGFRCLGRDAAGQPVLHVLDGHPFWVASAFLPLHGRSAQDAHPLVLQWLRASSTRRSSS